MLDELQDLGREGLRPASARSTHGSTELLEKQADDKSLHDIMKSAMGIFRDAMSSSDSEEGNNDDEEGDSDWMDENDDDMRHGSNISVGGHRE